MKQQLIEALIRVVLYARVSTNGERQDPEMQLAELREYAARRGWQVVGEYVDRCTGGKESRPQLNQLTSDAKSRRFDAVVVWKLDRYARSLKHLVNALAEFESLGIALRTIVPS